MWPTYEFEAGDTDSLICLQQDTTWHGGRDYGVLLTQPVLTQMYSLFRIIIVAQPLCLWGGLHCVVGMHLHKKMRSVEVGYQWRIVTVCHGIGGVTDQGVTVIAVY